MLTERYYFTKLFMVVVIIYLLDPFTPPPTNLWESTTCPLYLCLVITVLTMPASARKCSVCVQDFVDCAVPLGLSLAVWRRSPSQQALHSVAFLSLP